MDGFVLFAFSVYFGAMLTVSGLTKLDNPDYFLKALRLYGIFPKWLIRFVATVFPWFELALAVVLVAGIFQHASAAVSLMLFTSFLVLELILLSMGKAVPCGCYGLAFPRKVDSTSVVTSALLVSLAGIHFHLAGIGDVMVPPAWRALAVAALMAVILFMGWQIRRRHRAVAMLGSSYF